jgi:glycosyltransferase involved in cell wall biosynthesis
MEASWTRATIRAARPAVTDWVAVSTAALRPFDGVIPSDQVTVLPNGIEPDRLRPARSREEVRAAWGFRPQDKVVGYVGRISIEKLPRALFLAVAHLPAHYKAVYVGDFTPNPESAGPFQEAARAALGDRVRFSPALEAVGDIYHALDVHFSASPAEGFGLANVEALYCVCPLVTARTGILVDVARSDGVFWVEIDPYAEPEAHANAIRRCAEADAGTLAGRATKARAVIKARYLAEHQAARWEAYLADRLGRAL